MCRCRSTRSSASQAGDDVAVEGPLVDLGQRVVEALAVAERLVQRRVEAVEEAQLELVGALEEVLQLGEDERDVGRLVPRLRLEPVGRHGCRLSRSGTTGCCVAKSKNGDRARVRSPSRRREGQVQVLLRAGDRDVEQAGLVLDGAAVAVRVRRPPRPG